MHIILFFILSIVVILGSFSAFMFLSFKGQLSNGITFAEMEKCEEEISRKYARYATQFRKSKSDGSVDYVDIHALTAALRLKVEQTTLPSQMRGALGTPPSSEYNGIIRYAKDEEKLYSENFDIMHEIVHYIKDVGVGKRVDKSFARTHHGNPRSHQEQVIDYYAAAMAIPQESLKKRINAYQKDPYDDQFVEEMMEVYKQPKETVIRRIGEVLSLS